MSFLSIIGVICLRSISVWHCVIFLRIWACSLLLIVFICREHVYSVATLAVGGGSKAWAHAVEVFDVGAAHHVIVEIEAGGNGCLSYIPLRYLIPFPPSPLTLCRQIKIQRAVRWDREPSTISQDVLVRQIRIFALTQQCKFSISIPCCRTTCPHLPLLFAYKLITRIINPAASSTDPPIIVLILIWKQMLILLAIANAHSRSPNK